MQDLAERVKHRQAGITPKVCLCDRHSTPINTFHQLAFILAPTFGPLHMQGKQLVLPCAPHLERIDSRANITVGRCCYSSHCLSVQIHLDERKNTEQGFFDKRHGNRVDLKQRQPLQTKEASRPIENTNTAVMR